MSLRFSPILITLILLSLLTSIVVLSISLQDLGDNDQINGTVFSPIVAGITGLYIMGFLTYESSNVWNSTPKYTSIYTSLTTIASLSIIWALWAVAFALRLADYIPRTTSAAPFFDYNGGATEFGVPVVIMQGIQLLFITGGMLGLSVVERRQIKGRGENVPMNVLSSA